MQLHELKPIHKAKKKKRVGRGGKRGTYSGKGVKGQKSRAGRKMVPLIREMIKRYPKLRGYRQGKIFKNLIVFNLDILEKRFEPKEIVSPQSLLKKEIIRKIKGKVPGVKILGTGELKKPLVIEGCKVSKSAKQIIEKLGGTIK
ncbi:uL15 family ribosomal protein [Patescibacteria group bacterium]|nr:uL15 family ribosomal protein [Patescibacteria group bacterium]